MALEGALVGYVVTQLLDQVLTAINLVKDHDKNLTALRSLLKRLQPLVSPFCNLGATPPPGAVVWLKHLEGRLEEAALVVQDWKMQNMMHLWKTVRTARKVINVTTAIKDLLLEAGIVVLTTLLEWQGQHINAGSRADKVALPHATNWSRHQSAAGTGKENVVSSAHSEAIWQTRRCESLWLCNYDHKPWCLCGKRNWAEWNRLRRQRRHYRLGLEWKLHDRLQFSIGDRPRIHRHLKACIYYFAEFPEDLEVPVSKDLLGSWIGDGIRYSGN